MFRKFFVCLIIGSTLCCSVATAATVKKKPSSTKSYNFKPGDVLAVEVSLNGKVQIILVRVRDDLSMYYVQNGNEIPFPLVDLDNFVWAFYIKK